MLTFNKLRDIDSDVHSVLERNTELIFDLFKKEEIKDTAFILFSFIGKTNFIKEGILELYESENLYSVNILFRSLIEHHLKFLYIFIRVFVDKNHSVSEDYMLFCSLSENIDTGKAWKDVASLRDKDPNLDPYEALKEFNSDFKKYSREEIINRSKQFQYKNIIRYIRKNLDHNGQMDGNFVLLKLIPAYADLSSFLHGGPYADKFIWNQSDVNKRNEYLIDKMELSCLIAAWVKLYTFLFYYQFDKRFGVGYNEIDALIKKISDN